MHIKVNAINCSSYSLLSYTIVFLYRNPRVPCRSGIIPSLNLNKWADFPTSSSNVDPFIFDHIPPVHTIF